MNEHYFNNQMKKSSDIFNCWSIDINHTRANKVRHQTFTDNY